MGVVVLANDEELNISVALKLLPESVSDDTEGILRFKSEVLRGMTLSHPGIVRIHTFERDARDAGIVMEYVPGDTLADAKARQRGNCFDCHEILPWIEQLCVALDYAHGEAHVAHRDLKPRNIMLTPEGRVKLTDFGLASLLSESLTRVATSANAIGTPPYMSPQQVLGKPATRVDDIYALGATIYDLLTSRPPFFRGDIFAQVLHEEAPSMARRRQDLGVTGKAEIPRTWERAIAACLAKEPEARPASGAVLIEMLREVEVPLVETVRVKRPAASKATSKASSIDDSSVRLRSANSVRPAPEKTDIRPAPQPRPRAAQTRRNGVMKFLLNLALIVALAAIVAAFVHRARRSAQPQAAATPVPAKTVEGTGRLGAPALETSRLDNGAARSETPR
jgi:serine/threonine protein kinase